MTTKADNNIFIQDVDSTTRDNIIGLYQQLKDLRSEVEHSTKGDAQRIPLLLNEIDEALKSIEHLVNMVIPADEEVKNSLFQSEAMHQFQKTLEQHVAQITKLKDN